MTYIERFESTKIPNLQRIPKNVFADDNVKGIELVRAGFYVALSALTTARTISSRLDMPIFKLSDGLSCQR